MKLALSLPDMGIVGNNPAKNFPTLNFTLADAINKFGEVALYVGAFMMFFWAVWGVFDYLKAEGNKEALAKARKKIQWAIAGFIILLMAFFVSDFLYDVLINSLYSNHPQPLQNITDPKSK